MGNFKIQKAALAAVVCFGLTACEGIPMKTFEFDAIDLDEEKRAALIVVGDGGESWSTATSKQQVVNHGDVETLRLEVPFQSREITVHVWPLGESGDVPRSPGEARNMVSDYKKQTRQLRLNDPARQLFILDPK